MEGRQDSGRGSDDQILKIAVEWLQITPLPSLDMTLSLVPFMPYCPLATCVSQPHSSSRTVSSSLNGVFFIFCFFTTPCTVPVDWLQL